MVNCVASTLSSLCSQNGCQATKVIQRIMGGHAYYNTTHVHNPTYKILPLKIIPSFPWICSGQGSGRKNRHAVCNVREAHWWEAPPH